VSANGCSLLTYAYVERRWEEPVRMQHDAVLRHSVVNMMAKMLINCWKAGHSGSIPGMLIHLQEE